MREEFARDIIVFLREHGIDPWFAGGLIGFVVTVLEIREIRRWRSLEPHERRLAVVGVGGGIMMIITSLLGMLGLIS